MLHLLKVATSLPAPNDPAQRAASSPSIAAKLEGLYGKGKWCGTPAPGKAAPALPRPAGPRGGPREEPQLRRAARRVDRLAHHLAARCARSTSASSSSGTRARKEIGFRDLGELWRSGYDMTPADVRGGRPTGSGQQVKPLYDELHCYVRAQLAEEVRQGQGPRRQPIPAHLLGNMWAQEWDEHLPARRAVPGRRRSLDVDAALEAQKYDPTKMVKLGEAFFTSLGLDPLPADVLGALACSRSRGTARSCATRARGT